MDQKWIQVLLILMSCHELTSGADNEIQPKENEQVDIHCDPGPGSPIIWFRVLDKSRIQFIASFNNIGIKAQSSDYSQLFTHSRISSNKLTLKSFHKGTDSGIYSCGLLQNGKLNFGKVTRLTGAESTAPTEAPLTCVTPPNVVVTTTPCVCNNKKGSGDPSMFCAPLILGSLAGGCGLLLLLLIATILYCNRIRTRRCPHHYKRKRAAPEKQMMTNRHG